MVAKTVLKFILLVLSAVVFAILLTVTAIIAVPILLATEKMSKIVNTLHREVTRSLSPPETRT